MTFVPMFTLPRLVALSQLVLLGRATLSFALFDPPARASASRFTAAGEFLFSFGVVDASLRFFPSSPHSSTTYFVSGADHPFPAAGDRADPRSNLVFGLRIHRPFVVGSNASVDGLWHTRGWCWPALGAYTRGRHAMRKARAARCLASDLGKTSVVSCFAAAIVRAEGADEVR